MRLDDVELVVGEAALLVEDLLGDSDLADVVELARGLEQLALAFGQPDAPREVRLMASTGALPLPPVELATVRFLRCPAGVFL